MVDMTTVADADHKDGETERRSSASCVDIGYRRKLILTIAVCWSYVVLGWVICQIGTALPDLQRLAGVDLKAASWLFTSWSIGYVIGSLVSGFLFDRWDRLGTMLVSSLGMAACSAGLPYSGSFMGMLAVRLLTGVFCGGSDTGANTIIPSTWNARGRPYMQVLYLSYTVGGILSPLATRPFMHHKLSHNTTRADNSTPRDRGKTSTDSYRGMARYNDSMDLNQLNTSLHQTHYNATHYDKDFEDTSSIHYAFLMTGAIVLTSAIPYFIMLLNGKFDKREEEGVVSKEKNELLENRTEMLEVHDSKEVGHDAKENSKSLENRTEMLLNGKYDSKEKENDSEERSELLNTLKGNTNSKDRGDYSIENNGLLETLDSKHDSKERGDYSKENEELLEKRAGKEETCSTSLPSQLAFLTFLSRLKRSDYMKCLVLLWVAGINSMYGATEDSLGDFLVTFCLDYLGWGNSAAASISSLYWVASCLGGLVGVFIMRKFTPTQVLWTTLVLWNVSFLVIVLASVWKVDVLVWVFVPVSGLSMVFIIPTVISWTSENVCEISGRVSSVFMVATGIGLGANPSFIGFMMERYNYICFFYILFSESVLCIVLFALANIMNRCYSKESSSEVETVDESCA